jgi:uncharacterized protein (TIGR00255 family)
MTGYGRGEATNGETTVVVEIKSVNNRFRDLNLRVPREYMVLEPRVQKELQERVHRGRLDVFVRRSAMDGGQTVVPDLGLALKYERAMLAIAQKLGRLNEPAPLSLILSQPGVLSPSEPEADALAEWGLVATALDAALRDLAAMRAVEGEALHKELQRLLDELQRHWADVHSAADGIQERLRQRLSERLHRLLGELADPHRLTMEAAILADKADVTEELARIRSHCKQFADSMKLQEPVGRKLDFLLQELNREVNTVGSKSAEHPISAHVVDMKSVLERMREQVANIE